MYRMICAGYVIKVKKVNCYSSRSRVEITAQYIDMCTLHLKIVATGSTPPVHSRLPTPERRLTSGLVEKWLARASLEGEDLIERILAVRKVAHRRDPIDLNT